MSLSLDPTRLAGLLAFAVSTAACSWAWGRSRRALWGGLAAVHALLWLDMLLNARHRLHDAVNAGLRALGAYESRVWLQGALLLGLLLLVGLAWRRRRQIGAAAAATLVLVALVVVEAISWHQSDRVLYTHLGPLLLIAYAWIGGAAVVTASAWRQR